MNDDELAAALRREINSALGGDADGELASIRAKAWDYFLGEPIGGEREGHSQVVSSDLADVVDWIMPEVVRAFGSGDAAVEFAANGPQDEAQTENENKAVSHVFFRQNTGLLILHDWFQEALLQKNGYVKPYWDDTPEYRTETYENLSDLEFEALSMEAEITSDEVIEVSTPDEFGSEISEIRHNVEARFIESSGRIAIDVIPANEALINSDHRKISLRDARLSGHQREVTQSELIEMGYPRELVDDLPSYDDTDDDEEEVARRHITDEQDYDNEPADRSQRKILLTEAYWLVDADGDGVSERYFVHYAGNKILTMEPDDSGLIVSLTAMPLANKHLGRSLYDKIRQIQDIKTAVWRQMIDNLFQINNSRFEAVEGQVNIRELLNNRAGGVVRVKQPGMINPLKVPSIGPDAYQFIEYLDKVRTERSGVGPEIVSELGQLANSTAWGVERLMAKKEELVGMIIAIFRATGVNELFERIHEILRENADGPMAIPVDGEWLEQDPRKWPKRMAVPPVTWSGMGDKLEKQKALQHLMGLQEKIGGSPYSWMIGEQHIYESVSDFIRTSGLTNLKQYMYDPRTQEGMAARQQFMEMQANKKSDADILAKVEQIKGQYQAQIAQLREASKLDVERLKAALKASQDAADMRKHEDEMAVRWADLDRQFEEKMTQIEADLLKANQPQQLPGGAINGY